MNKDRVNGAIDDVVGSAKRKVGVLTDNPKLQVKGMAQQVKGKVEKALGKTQEVVSKVNKKTAEKPTTHMKVELACSATVPRCTKQK